MARRVSPHLRVRSTFGPGRCIGRCCWRRPSSRPAEDTRLPACGTRENGPSLEASPHRPEPLTTDNGLIRFRSTGLTNSRAAGVQRARTRRSPGKVRLNPMLRAMGLALPLRSPTEPPRTPPAMNVISTSCGSEQSIAGSDRSCCSKSSSHCAPCASAMGIVYPPNVDSRPLSSIGESPFQQRRHQGWPRWRNPSLVPNVSAQVAAQSSTT